MDDSYNSYSRKQLDDLFLKMIAYYGGDPKRIQHFVKVHSFARIIAVGEHCFVTLYAIFVSAIVCLCDGVYDAVLGTPLASC